MTSARWILGLCALLLAGGAAHGQQCPPPGGSLHPGLIVDVHRFPAQPSATNLGGPVAGATVCIVEATAAGPEYGTFAYNITLLPPTTSGSQGYACFNFAAPARAVGMLRGDFRGTLVVRAHKDGYCADEVTIAYEGPVHEHLRLKEILPASNERVWCGSKAGMRCDVATPSPFREAAPHAAPELLQQAPAAGIPEATMPSPGTPAPIGPRDTLTQPVQRR